MFIPCDSRRRRSQCKLSEHKHLKRATRKLEHHVCLKRFSDFKLLSIVNGQSEVAFRPAVASYSTALLGSLKPTGHRYLSGLSDGDIVRAPKLPVLRKCQSQA